MNTKSVFLCSLVLAISAYRPCGAQQLPVAATPMGTPPTLPADAISNSNESNQLTPSNWIRYSQPECCNSIGCNGPIKMELYERTGASFNMGGGDIPQRLNTAGYMIEAGGRSIPALRHLWATREFRPGPLQAQPSSNVSYLPFP